MQAAPDSTPAIASLKRHNAIRIAQTLGLATTIATLLAILPSVITTVATVIRLPGPATQPTTLAMTDVIAAVGYSTLIALALTLRAATIAIVLLITRFLITTMLNAKFRQDGFAARSTTQPKTDAIVDVELPIPTAIQPSHRVAPTKLAQKDKNPTLMTMPSALNQRPQPVHLGASMSG